MARSNRTFNSPKLNAMKYEIASQLGMSNYQTVDKGNLTSRQNGYVGGNITKSLVAQALGETAKLETSSTTPTTTSGSSISGFPGLSE
ncbi:MAG: small, acid-soluble spore protein, alpha/beta type [Methylocystaceae bacterium]